VGWNDELTQLILIALGTSASVNLIIMLTQRWHGVFSGDHDIDGVQKFHTRVVPRIGGIGIWVGVMAAVLWMGIPERGAAPGPQTLDGLLLLLAGLPAFAAGTLEDITKKVSVRNRLIATFLSAFLASWWLGAVFHEGSITGLESILAIAPLAVLFTAFAVAGFSNAINIIDGFNGIAGVAVVIMLSGIGFLAWQAGDMFVLRLALVIIAATVGFLIFNYPTGRIFLGDGGAYLLGFLVAELAVLLTLRNPTIDGWQILAICAYPVIEVVYSMARRKLDRKRSLGTPDSLHLHTLIYRRLVCKALPKSVEGWIRNSMVAPVVAVWIGVAAMLAVLLGQAAATALIIVIAQMILYVCVYSWLGRNPGRDRDEQGGDVELLNREWSKR